MSSGIDSVYIYQILKNIVSPVTISYNFTKDQKIDEINEVLNLLKIKKTLFKYFSDEEIKEKKLLFIEISDTLSIDGVKFLLISEFIKNNNFKVALSGFGADELFNSYPSLKYLKLLQRKNYLFE